MILAVGGEKGSPGATTLATVLALAWPGERVLAEFDPRGADLPFRLKHASGGPVQERPSIATLAVDARPGDVAPTPTSYAQHTSVGVALIPGELSSWTMASLTPHMAAIATAAVAWPSMMIADLGALLPGNPALVFAKSAVLTVLTTRSTLAGLARLVECVDSLIDLAGDPSRTAAPVGVVVVAETGDAKAAAERATRLLAAAGSPAPVIGTLAHDPTGVAVLYGGAPSKKLAKSPLVRSARELVASITATWPELTAAKQSPIEAGDQARPSADGFTDAPPWRTPMLDWPAPRARR